MSAYAVVRGFADLLLRAYFRQISVVGLENIAATGPLIFAANHPNALVDPLLVLNSAPRVIRFAAKDTLFKAPWFLPILRALKAVPIRRRQDHGGQSIDNSAAFRALHDALHRGECIGIFPEGISHDQAMLARLKTGTARIALATQAENPSTRVALIPCGLVYLSRTRFRARVLVQFGTPIEISSDLMDAYRHHDSETVAQLTTRLEHALSELTINAEDWETLRVLDTVRRLFQPPRLTLAQRVEVARRFARTYTSLRDHPEIIELRQRVLEYQAKVRELGLRDADLSDRLHPARTMAKAARQSFLFALWLLLGLPGMILHAPILIFAKVVERWIAHDHGDLRATVKLVAAIVATFVVYGALLISFTWFHGVAGLMLAGLALPLLGIATLNLLDRQVQLRRLSQSLLRIITHRKTVRELMNERFALQEAIAKCVLRKAPQVSTILEHQPV